MLPLLLALAIPIEFRGRFPEPHLRAIERLLEQHKDALHGYRNRPIEELTDEGPEVEALFGDFEEVLGPVGAAKAMDLLAPRFFPIWDRKIAVGYGCRLGQRGRNASKYWRFMQVVAEDCQELGGGRRSGAKGF